MDQIKQAMDQVSKQQSGEIGSSPQARQVSNVSSPADSLEEVNYNRTKVVQLNADLLERNRIVAYNKNDPKSMIFDVLRTHILQKMEENGWRTLAITSPMPEAGKTVVAINLAMSIAQQTDKTAMLVDFDLRRPKIGSYLGLPMEKSLNDLLEGNAELADVLVNPDIQRLVVLATKKSVRKSTETLSSKKIANLINELRERYESRIIIFDLPPLLVTDDAIALLPRIDCVLMVVGNGMSTKRELEDCLRQLPAAKLVGTVLNKAEVDPKAYYYYY